MNRETNQSSYNSASYPPQIGLKRGRKMRNPISSSSSSEKSAKTAAAGKVVGLKKGPWTAEEDEILSSYIRREGEGKWRMLPKRAGLLRCGKSCRLRWMNYLRPSVKRGHIAADEEDLILRMHRLLGNRWSLIAGRIPGRTDNEIKNYWNTHLSKKLISQGIDPTTHKPLILPLANTCIATNYKPPSSSSSTKLPASKPQSSRHHPSNFPMPSSTSSENVVFTYDDDHQEHREGKLPMMIPSRDGVPIEGDCHGYDDDDDDDDTSCSIIGHGYQDMMLMMKNCYTSSHVVHEDKDDDDAFSSFLNSLINEEEEEQVFDTESTAALARPQSIDHDHDQAPSDPNL